MLPGDTGGATVDIAAATVGADLAARVAASRGRGVALIELAGVTLEVGEAQAASKHIKTAKIGIRIFLSPCIRLR